ncbi:TRAP-like protein, putative [Plasmodium ovale]|uniref:TRAP-like protein, putative n=1 Tax=Plasmodium ovale TaxID=36330 RepID=A0A1C3KUF3_PLAOA|nr:TRAP-like protein, putative [Plasmodium ovale]
MKCVIPLLPLWGTLFLLICSVYANKSLIKKVTNRGDIDLVLLYDVGLKDNKERYHKEALGNIVQLGKNLLIEDKNNVSLTFITYDNIGVETRAKVSNNRSVISPSDIISSNYDKNPFQYFKNAVLSTELKKQYDRDSLHLKGLNYVGLNHFLNSDDKKNVTKMVIMFINTDGIIPLNDKTDLNIINYIYDEKNITLNIITQVQYMSYCLYIHSIGPNTNELLRCVPKNSYYNKSILSYTLIKFYDDISTNAICSEWTEWSKCSVTCNMGYHFTRRESLDNITNTIEGLYKRKGKNCLEQRSLVIQECYNTSCDHSLDVCDIELDVSILIGDSSNMSQEFWLKYVIQPIRKLIVHFNLSENLVNISLTSFSNKTYSWFDFTNSFSKNRDELLIFLEYWRYNLGGNGKHINNSLRYLYTNVMASNVTRPNAKKVVLIFTAGEVEDNAVEGVPETIAQIKHKYNANVYSICINNTNDSNCRKLSSTGIPGKKTGNSSTGIDKDTISDDNTISVSASDITPNHSFDSANDDTSGDAFGPAFDPAFGPAFDPAFGPAFGPASSSRSGNMGDYSYSFIDVFNLESRLRKIQKDMCSEAYTNITRTSKHGKRKEKPRKISDLPVRTDKMSGDNNSGEVPKDDFDGHDDNQEPEERNFPAVNGDGNHHRDANAGKAENAENGAGAHVGGNDGGDGGGNEGNGNRDNGEAEEEEEGGEEEEEEEEEEEGGEDDDEGDDGNIGGDGDGHGHDHDDDDDDNFINVVDFDHPYGNGHDDHLGFVAEDNDENARDDISCGSAYSAASDDDDGIHCKETFAGIHPSTENTSIKKLNTHKNFPKWKNMLSAYSFREGRGNMGLKKERVILKSVNNLDRIKDGYGGDGEDEASTSKSMLTPTFTHNPMKKYRSAFNVNIFPQEKKRNNTFIHKLLRILFRKKKKYRIKQMDSDSNERVKKFIERIKRLGKGIGESENEYDVAAEDDEGAPKDEDEIEEEFQQLLEEIFKNYYGNNGQHLNDFDSVSNSSFSILGDGEYDQWGSLQGALPHSWFYIDAEEVNRFTGKKLDCNNKIGNSFEDILELEKNDAIMNNSENNMHEGTDEDADEQMNEEDVVEENPTSSDVWLLQEVYFPSDEIDDMVPRRKKRYATLDDRMHKTNEQEEEEEKSILVHNGGDIRCPEQCQCEDNVSVEGALPPGENKPHFSENTLGEPTEERGNVEQERHHKGRGRHRKRNISKFDIISKFQRKMKIEKPSVVSSVVFNMENEEHVVPREGENLSVSEKNTTQPLEEEIVNMNNETYAKKSYAEERDAGENGENGMSAQKEDDHDDKWKAKNLQWEYDLETIRRNHREMKRNKGHSQANGNGSEDDDGEQGYTRVYKYAASCTLAALLFLGGFLYYMNNRNGNKPMEFMNSNEFATSSVVKEEECKDQNIVICDDTSWK